MVLSGSLKATRKRRNWSLWILACLIASVSTWSMLCSWLYLNADVTDDGAPDLKARQPRNVANQIDRGVSKEKPHSTIAKKVLNSEIYNPPAATLEHRRLITYNRHGGRLNNQIIQFIGAIQHAKILKRRLVVPDEKVAVEWTGLLDDSFHIWNLTTLKQAYDIDWESGLEVNKDKARKDGFVLNVPKQCVLNQFQLMDLLIGGPSHWMEWDRKCPDILNLGQELPLCSPKHSFCGDSEAISEARNIYSHLRLSSYMQSLLPPTQPLAVHSRRAGEGGYDWEICIDPTKRVCQEHVREDEWNKYCNERTVRGNCAIWADLSYAIKDERFWKEKEKEYRFNLASDGTHDWSIDYSGQFVMANSTSWLQHMEEVAQQRIQEGETLQSLGNSFFLRDRLKNQKGQNPLLSRAIGIMFQLSSTILEMFSLVNSDYFVGGFYSTFSLNVCYLRGLDRVMNSNMCWMLLHPDTEKAIPPPVEHAINIPIDDNAEETMPPALMSDVEHAFVTSDDGKFFVIDRYRFMFRRPNDRGKIPTFISVLGQGVVPMTIEKLSNGEDRIHANFTCSMGNQMETKASIYILGKDEDSPVEDNPDTLFIVCYELKYDPDVTIQPPLSLQSQDGSFSLRIGSNLVRARNVPRLSHGSSIKTWGLLHCLLPSSRKIDPDWLLKYLRHHKSLGVQSHVHIYNVDWHSPQIQSILNDYRGEKFISRHDWSTRAKSRSSAANNFTNNLARSAAKMDCMLRSRGVDSYALFSEIDEFMDGSDFPTQLKYCEDNFLDRCPLDVSVAPPNLIEGNFHLTSVSEIQKKKRECVNIKNLTLPPWTLIT
eukprot:CCRYP_004937-RB/>CCRYP_004937-RB protein AED:0.04 eAED:0.04 QI:104/1/1/1/1/1/4/48/822